MLLDRTAPVLLVEPRASATRIMTDLLLHLGFEMIDAVTGSNEAVDLLREKGPRLVIADLHIEPMNGLQLLRTIRSDERLKRTPFIIAAETLSPAEAVAIKGAGVDSFLLKPFRAEALEKKVEAALLARPSARTVPEPIANRSLTAALGRRYQRHRA
jgi:two-component system chemotaxis response regulator CheY